MNKYIYLLAVVFGLSSCNDFLELSPTNKVIETDYYKTQEDLTEALVAAYDPWKWNAYNAYSSYELVSNIMSDDAETGGSTVSDQPQLQRVNDFTNWVTPTNLPEGLWGRSYEGVNRANIVIEKCPLLPEGTMSAACGTERRGRGTNRPAGIERYPGRAGHGIPGSDRRARTEGAGHPYQPGNIRETSGTGRITKQGGQVRS